jgi:putative membrane protein
MLTAWLLPGIHVDGFFTAILVALALALLNVFIKPIFIILTIPITIFTFGLFLFVINALIILIAGHFIGGFQVDGFWWALFFSIILTIISSLLGISGRRENQ